LHPKLNMKSELKWQTCFGTVPSKVSCSSVKGLKAHLFQEHLHSFYLYTVSEDWVIGMF